MSNVANEKYKQIDLKLGSSIEEVVQLLLDHKEKGELVSAKFNNVTLYSDTVTLEDAYQLILGRTKKEHDEVLEDWMVKLQEQKREFERRIPELADMWKEKAREVLTEDKWSEWDEIVPFRLKDLYQGMELGATLEIVKILNSGGTLEEAKEKIESQNHSGMSFSLVSMMVRKFCNRGEEFYYYLNSKS